MRKAALHNLGCKVNSYETEAMQQMLEEAGYEIVPFREGADVYVINTCSVTNIADRKSRQMLHRARKMNPDAVVVAAGCYVQAAGEELKKDEAIDIVIGNNKKTELIEILNAWFEARQEEELDSEAARGEKYEAARKEKHETACGGTRFDGGSHIIDIGKTNEYERLSIRKIADHTRAFIKIQDGCNQFCSYCIIPYTRGRVRSREVEDIVSEVETLVAAGYQEIVLTGIHLSSYGVDFAEEKKENLLGLIVRLDGILGLKRIRLGSLEPRIVTEEFVRTLAGLRTICPHFHLSLQSGCDETLKRMNRHYTTEDYAARCELLRKYFDRPAITTDVIVGFPGETEEEFETTRKYLERVHFYEMHVFKYSKRGGTKAAVMENQVPEQKKAERSDVLLELTERMSKEFRERFLGCEKEVLLEEKVTVDGVDYLVGHTKEYVKAAIPWDEKRKGTMITGYMDHLLTDEIIELLKK